MDPAARQIITCPHCGRMHVEVPLRLGERALCVSCGSRLPRARANSDAALAFTVTALILAWPALNLPVVTVRKFGSEHASHLWSGVRALWNDGMPMLSVWVAFCGIIVPLALVTALLVSLPPGRPDSMPARPWARLARALEHWSMPEVQVLAVLVAFVKIGALVHVTPGAGLWFYGAMTVSLLFAWRSLESEAHVA